jgi:heme O synthase-like polyprenyltransferase
MLSRLVEKGSRLRLAPLLCAWVIALMARVTLFSSGGVGAWLCVIAFWAVTAALLVLAIQRLRSPAEEEKARYIFVIVGLLAFGYRVVMLSGLIAEISTAVWLLCAIGLLATYIRVAVQHWRHAASH